MSLLVARSTSRPPEKPTGAKALHIISPPQNVLPPEINPEVGGKLRFHEQTTVAIQYVVNIYKSLLWQHMVISELT